MSQMPSILFLITADPRTSQKTAEAVRIAAGVGTWQKAEVTVYLRGDAVLALDEFSDELVEGDNFSRYLPLLTEGDKPIYVQRGAKSLPEAEKSPVKFKEISDKQLADLCAKSTYVARF